MGRYTPQEWERDLSCACVTADLVPLLNTVAGGGAKANLANMPSLLRRLDTPISFQHAWDPGRGLLKMESAGKQKVIWFFPLPQAWGGAVSMGASRHTSGGLCEPVSGGLKAQTPKDA